MFFEIGVLKNFAIFTRKQLLESLFDKIAYLQACNFIKKWLQHWRFLRILRNFLRTLRNKCYWNLIKVFFDLWNRHYHSELLMKNVVHVHFIKRLHQNICKRAKIFDSTNNLVWRFKKSRTFVRENKTSSWSWPCQLDEGCSLWEINCRFWNNRVSITKGISLNIKPLWHKSEAVYLINKMIQYLCILQYSLYENKYIRSGSLQSMR